MSLANLRSRMRRVAQVVGDMPRPDAIDIITTWAAHRDQAKRPPGEYFNPAGNCVTVLSEGKAPDPAVMKRLKARLGPDGIIINVIAHEDYGDPGDADGLGGLMEAAA